MFSFYKEKINLKTLHLMNGNFEITCFKAGFLSLEGSIVHIVIGRRRVSTKTPLEEEENEV